MQWSLARPCLLFHLILLVPLFSCNLWNRLWGRKASRSARGIRRSGLISSPREGNAPLSSPSRASSSSTHNDLKSTIQYPPLLLFILSTQSCGASPLNPQIIATSGPFFQGWLVRQVDHSQNTSFILVIGSFSSSQSATYDEHYIFCGLHSKATGSQEHHIFPSEVDIHGTSPALLSDNINVTWSAKDIGFFKLEGEKGQVDLEIKDIRLKCQIENRVPWKTSSPLSAPSPEGWLGYTPLLPCHYAIHSTGSSCDYSLTITSKGQALRGKGHCHIEGNHGNFFPDGWVWSQAIAPSNKASMSLIGGRFVVGGLSLIQWVVYLRRGNKINIFRTIDLDKFAYEVNPFSGMLRVTAVTLSGMTKMEITITSDPIHSYTPPLYIPTRRGFQNSPGCRETYTALAKVAVLQRSGEGDGYYLEEEVEFPLTALEFGGLFQFSRLQKGDFRNKL